MTPAAHGTASDLRGAGLELTVLDACPVVLVVLDARPAIVWGNAALRELTQSWGDVVGRLAWDLLPVEVGLCAVTCLPEAHATLPEVPEQVWTDACGRSRRIAWSLTLLPEPTGRDGGGRLLATGVDVTAERRHQATWRERAYTDPLTGLANRAAARAALDRCLDPRRGSGCAVVIGDLDGLKEINDRGGHAAGDLVLQQVARRLGELARPDDVVARIGGDEFVVILPGAGSRDAAGRLALLESAFAGPTRVLDEDVEVGISLGLRIARAGEDPAGVLHDADMAMYADKRRRKAAARVVRSP